MTDDMSTKPTDGQSGSSAADTAGNETDAGEETGPVAAGGTSENADTAESTTRETPAGGAGEAPPDPGEATAGAHEAPAGAGEAPAGADEAPAGSEKATSGVNEAAADPNGATPTEGSAPTTEAAAMGDETPPEGTGAEVPAAATGAETTPAATTGAAAAAATGAEATPAAATGAAPAAAAVGAAGAAATAGAPAAQIFESGYKPPPGSAGSSRIKRIARSTVAVILIVLGILCLTLSPLTIWGRNLILNTDRYVETLKPIAHNPGVQDAIVTAVDKQVNNNISIPDLISQSNLPPRAANALGPALQSAISGLVNTVVTRFVQSKAFETLWVTINRSAHTQLVYFLTGSRSSALKVNSHGELVLDLSPVVDNVKKQLVSAGLTVASHIPTVGATIEIAQVKGVEKVRQVVKVLNTLADWLPWIGLALLAGGIAMARKHRRTFIISMFGVVAGMVVIGIGLLIGRHFYLNGIPPDVLPSSTAGQVFDTVVRFLREGIRIVAVVALLLAFIAWLLGPSTYAVSARRWIKTGYHAAVDWAGRGSFGDFVGAHTMPITWATVGVGLIVFLLLGLGSLASIITIVVIFAVLVLLIQAIGLTNARYREAASPASPAGG
jgi:hypothetical protein